MDDNDLTLSNGVPVDNLMNPTELAEHFGVSRGAVWNWEKRYEAYPKPVFRNLWDVEEVELWHRSLS